jgi:coatomer subunit beta
MEFLGDSNTGSAVDVVQFVRQVVEVYVDLRQSITRKLLESLGQVKSSKVYRGALWIIGEYAQSSEDIDSVFSTLREAIGDLPLFVEDVNFI